MKLSLLDQVPIRADQSRADAIRESLEAVKTAENCGYHRYWFAEHHQVTQFASSNPRIILAHAASLVSEMRLGVGGIMLSHYSAFQVIEDALMLSNLSPKLDIAVGRALAADDETTALLSGETSCFQSKLDVLQKKPFFLKSKHCEILWNEWNSIKKSKKMQLWLLGSSIEAANLARIRDLSLAYSYFNSPKSTQASLACYDGNSHSSESKLIHVHLLCGSNIEEIRLSQRSYAMHLLSIMQNGPGPLPSREAVTRTQLTDSDIFTVQKHMAKQGILLGTPQDLTDQLWSLGQSLSLHEIMVSIYGYDQESRLSNLAMLKHAWDKKITSPKF